MSNKHCLPFQKSNIRSFANIAFADSICKANMNNLYEKYSIERFVNFCFDSEKYTFTLDARDIWGIERGLFICQNILLDKKEFINLGADISKIIRQLILLDFYVCGKIGTEKEIYCITAYDETIQTFDVWMFSNIKGQFLEKIKFNKIEDLLFNAHENIIELLVYKYNHENNYKFELENIEKSIRKYLESTHSTLDRMEGLMAIRELCDYLKIRYENMQSFDECYLYGFYEQKKFTYELIEYLTSRGIVSEEFKLFSKNVYDIGNTIVELGLAYNLNKDSELAKKAVLLMNKTIEMEEQYLFILLIEIQNFIKFDKVQ